MPKKVDYHIEEDTLYIKKLDRSELNKNWLHLIKKEADVSNNEAKVFQNI